MTAWDILGLLALLSFGLLTWQVTGALRFPLHRRVDKIRFTPGISVLKPLKGCDVATEQCLRSWLTQNYPGEIQVVFGVASLEDPVCDLARRLIADHPNCPARLVHCPEQLGANAKISQLIQMERIAEHAVLCVSDADVWVPADYVANAVAPLEDPGVGLTNCFYYLAGRQTLAMRWEACAVNVDFWSQVLQSTSLKPMDFALGAAMMTTRDHLARIGGFEPLADLLADDYQLGHRIAQTGASVVLSPIVVECRSGVFTAAEVWSHQLRWARTIRVCQPLPFFLSILGNASLWPLAWGLCSPGRWSLAGALGCLAFRLATAPILEGRLTGSWSASKWGMPILKDLLHAGIWALAFTGRHVTWRGIRYQVDSAGRLVRLDKSETASSSPVCTRHQTME